MNREDLIHALREHGLDQQRLKDLFLYYLSTEDRQIQMYEWLKGQPEGCGPEAVIHEAQRILNGYLSKNPYNIAAKDMPLPKWSPQDSRGTAPVKKEAGCSPESPSTAVPEDPFDKVLRALFA